MPTLESGRVTAAPFTRTSPRAGMISPAVSLRRVDFPHPLGPTKATVVPRGTAREMPSSARTGPLPVA